MAAMVNEQFRQWVKDVGVTKAAQLISDAEETRGNPRVTYQSIQDWLRDGNDIPVRRVISVEEVTGINRTVLAPHIYPEVA